MSKEKFPSEEELNKMPGRKQWAWAGYCMYADRCRKHFDPQYDRMKLSEESQLKDWLKFEEAYKEETEGK